MAKTENSEVMSVPEAGRILGKGRNKAYELAGKGAFPVIRLDGRLVVPRNRFMRWLNGETNGNNPNE